MHAIRNNVYRIPSSHSITGVVIRRRKDGVQAVRRKTFFIVTDGDALDGEEEPLARTRSTSKSFVPIHDSTDGGDDDDDDQAERDDYDADDGRSSLSSSSKKPSLTTSQGFDEGDDGDTFGDSTSPSNYATPPVAPPPPPPPPPLTLCIPARGSSTNVQDLVMISPPSRQRPPRGGGRRGASTGSISSGIAVFSDAIPSPISSVTSSRDTSPTRSGPLSSSECKRSIVFGWD